VTGRRAYRLVGRVQGVGFRWWARQTALDLDVRGTVRNEPDGSVRVEAAGEDDQLDRFEAALASGPPGARVESVDRIEPGDRSLPPRFEITR
jgi:acylphosphatase